MKRSIAIAVAASLHLSACNSIDSVTEGLAHSNAVASRLEKAYGTKSFVGFNWHNGTLTSVTVTFEGIPQNAALPEIASRSRDAIVAEFKQAPKQIVVGFKLSP